MAGLDFRTEVPAFSQSYPQRYKTRKLTGQLQLSSQGKPGPYPEHHLVPSSPSSRWARSQPQTNPTWSEVLPPNHHLVHSTTLKPKFPSPLASKAGFKSKKVRGTVISHADSDEVYYWLGFYCTLFHGNQVGVKWQSLSSNTNTTIWHHSCATVLKRPECTKEQRK